MTLIARISTKINRLRNTHSIGAAAQAQAARDHDGLPVRDPGAEAVVHEGIAWLGRAQDCSASHDGGVARDYSLVNGWATSYPETTGYIVPTMLEYARRYGNGDARARANTMLDWLARIQLPGGGFQGGRIDATPVVPVTFNTGQILLGLAAGVREFGARYERSMHSAAHWLANTLDPDGCWRRHPTPFATPGEKAYETHVAWGLFEAERVAPGSGYGEAGLRNVHWALTKQHSNGWFSSNSLTEPARPLTHTIGYVLRGVIEAYRLYRHGNLLEAALRTADGLLPAIQSDGYLSARLNERWEPLVDFVCLTGSVQIAHCLLMLYEYTGNTQYRDSAFALNSFVRRSIDLEGPPEVRGAVKGSFPIDGSYGRYEYLNWAAKFMIDSNLLELDVRSGVSSPQ
jgi:hypothetical protein